ncbi:hypothetical protein B0H11DRAFT_2056862 [Mycena galericulata]|nr:hypothetical protein B0H11DRAFT_2056862 [Mycena galericulata]
MHSLHLHLLCLFFFSVSQVSWASPVATLVERAPAKVKILTSKAAGSRTSRTTNYCSDDQFETIQTAILDLGTLTAAAQKVLSPTDSAVSNSEPIQSFLGPITSDALNSLVTLRYSQVQEFWSGVEQTLEQVKETTTGDKTLYLYCPPNGNDPDGCTAGADSSYAFTSNAGEKDAEFNEIALCPKFFQDKSLSSQVTTYQTDQRRNMKTDFTPLTNVGVVLLHESQHSLSALQSTDGADILEDLKNGGITAYTPKLCAALSPEDRQKNAENIAIVAFLAYADPSRFQQPEAGPATDCDGDSQMSSGTDSEGSSGSS